jgi:hypothetical protein
MGTGYVGRSRRNGAGPGVEVKPSELSVTVASPKPEQICSIRVVCAGCFEVGPRAGFRSSPEPQCGLRLSRVQRLPGQRESRANELPCIAFDKREVG